MAEITLSTGSFLTFGNKAESNIKWKHIRHRIHFHESVKSNTIVEGVVQQLWFQQDVDVNKIINLFAGNNLSLSGQAVPRALIEQAESGFPIAHWADVYKNQPTFSVLSLNQNVVCLISNYNPIDVLSLTQTVSFNLVKVQQLVQTLLLSHGVSVYKENKNFILPHPDV